MNFSQYCLNYKAKLEISFNKVTRSQVYRLEYENGYRQEIEIPLFIFKSISGKNVNVFESELLYELSTDYLNKIKKPQTDLHSDKGIVFKFVDDDGLNQYSMSFENVKPWNEFINDLIKGDK